MNCLPAITSLKEIMFHSYKLEKVRLLFCVRFHLSQKWCKRDIRQICVIVLASEEKRALSFAKFAYLLWFDLTSLKIKNPAFAMMIIDSNFIRFGRIFFMVIFYELRTANSHEWFARTARHSFAFEQAKAPFRFSLTILIFNAWRGIYIGIEVSCLF